MAEWLASDRDGLVAEARRELDGQANAVAAWLADAGGLDRAVISTRGYGETRPAFPNDSAANRQRNRRVVITTFDG